MARRTNSDESVERNAGPQRVHVVKLRLDADELKGLRVAAAMKAIRPSDWVRQIVLAEIQCVLDDEVPKLLQPKNK